MSYYDNVSALSPKIWFKFNETSGTQPVSVGEYSTITLSKIGFGTYLDQEQAGIVGNSCRLISQKYWQSSYMSQALFDDRTFSIELWHKHYPLNDSGNEVQLFNIGSLGSGHYLTLRYDEDGAPASRKYTFTWRGGTSYPVQAVQSNAVTQNDWHHIVITYTPSAVKIYVDGTLHSTLSNPNIPNAFTLDSNYFTIGGSGNRFNFYMDELAFYGQELTSTQVFNNYDSAYNAGYLAQVTTASALLPSPAVSAVRNPNYAAQVMTASATLPNAIQSARDNFTLLDTYMSTLTLEQWYQFDEPKNITNFGNGGPIGFVFSGSAKNELGSGIQGHGALRITGNTDQIVFAIGTNPVSTEFTDDDFSLGFWVKKASNEAATIMVSGSGTEYFAVYFNGNGNIEVNAYLQNQNHSITAATDYADNNWHYVAVRKSGNTMQMWVDNVSKGTVSVTHSMSAFNYFNFGEGSSATEQMYISQYYHGTSANITSTQIGNIWTYGQPVVQGGAAMPMPKFSRDNSLNTYIDSKSPNFSFRMDEASGVPLNYGSTTLSLTQQGTNFTQNISSPNYKSYNFTNRDTQFNGTWNATAGTFSTNNRQTMLVYAKFASAGLNGIGGTAGFGSGSGSGMFIQQLANSTLRLRLSDGVTTEDATTSATFADNAYHMFVAVKDGANLKLYVDGIERASNGSTTITLTDYGQLAIGGVPGQGPTAASRNLTIDEVSVFNTAFSAQDAFEAYQKIALVQDTTATALIVQPTTSLGYGPTINPGVGYATALLPDPTQQDTINNLATPLTATGLFQNPNYAATKNFNYSATPMTATVAGQDPVASAGGRVGALHMDASAYFPAAYVRVPGKWNADPATVSALMVQPALVTTKGALIKPQSLNASAFFALPPAYYLVTDDRWYQRLLLVDYQSNNFNGTTTFFNTSSDIVRGGGYGGWNAIDQRNVFNTYYGYNLTDSPLPVAYAGTYDPQNRKALRIRNIALVVSDGYTNSGANWTFETYIKTTKKNQILFVGKQLGDRSNQNYQDFNTAWRLRDGKISLNNEKSLREGWPNSTDLASFTGFKDIADGEWHHIIVQFRQTGEDKYFPRTQVFIDGELDIQRYGNRAYPIHQIGFNSADINSYSDFETSAVSINQGSFVLERETHLNYYAATGIIPVEAAVATASATLTTGNKGRGNRGRALMLYFWPTFKLDSPYYLPYQRFMSGGVGLGFTIADQGTYGYDPDTFYPIATQTGNKANQFYDWDIWPCPVTNYPSGDTYIGDSHPILKDGIFGETDKGLSYINPITDNERYLNLQEDLKDLSQFDMICFRNYPDDSGERDTYGTTAKGIADPYFNVLDKTLFDEFLVSLRDAVDSGISLLITNPQLAIDMGFIDTYHTVDALTYAGNTTGSDPYAPIKLNDPLGTGSPVLNIDYDTINEEPTRLNAYEDYYRNNYHQVVNTLPSLTDDPAYIWKDEVYYKVDGLEYGELDRIWSHIEYNAGLQPGDKFLISCMINAYSYYAIPMEAIKAGKVITKFADTYIHGTVERVNPYRNYATSIAVEPGTVVAGKQIGAKVFISFTDNVGNQKSLTPSYLNPGSNTPIENRMVELKSDYWIDYAYSTGSISDYERDQYKANAKNIDRIYPNGGAAYNALKYWTLNGQDLLAQANAFGDNSEIGTDTAESVKKGKAAAKTRAGMRRRNTVSTSSLPSYSIVSSWAFPIISVPVPNITTRGLWWLSERLEYNDGLPQRPLALEADAWLPQPIITGYKVVSVNAQAALASATIVETSLRSGTLSINSAPLPMTATAQLVSLGLNINPGVATASARITTNFSTVTSKDDDIVLYVMHEDPILYIREDAIK